VSGNTAALHALEMHVQIQLEIKKLFIIFQCTLDIVKVTNTELKDINQLMGYRDAH